MEVNNGSRDFVRRKVFTALGDEYGLLILKHSIVILSTTLAAN